MARSSPRTKRQETQRRYQIRSTHAYSSYRSTISLFKLLLEPQSPVHIENNIRRLIFTVIPFLQTGEKHRAMMITKLDRPASELRLVSFRWVGRV